MALTIESEQAASKAVKELKELLKKEKEDHDKWMAEKKTSLTKLKEELKRLKAHISVESKYKEKEARARVSCVSRVHQQSLDMLAEEEKRIQDEIRLESQVFEELKDFLQKKQRDMQEEVGGRCGRGGVSARARTFSAFFWVGPRSPPEERRHFGRGPPSLSLR